MDCQTKLETEMSASSKPALSKTHLSTIRIKLDNFFSKNNLSVAHDEASAAQPTTDHQNTTLQALVDVQTAHITRQETQLAELYRHLQEREAQVVQLLASLEGRDAV